MIFSFTHSERFPFDNISRRVIIYSISVKVERALSLSLSFSDWQRTLFQRALLVLNIIVLLKYKKNYFLRCILRIIWRKFISKLVETITRIFFILIGLYFLYFFLVRNCKKRQLIENFTQSNIAKFFYGKKLEQIIGCRY